ncbi:amidohydrolase family protein [Microbacteriaceae bacterium VKM Ac-2854]|nr:amidohydrolase family protein [Microbacteriaceae bacterium VKM Ac-2854]
MSDAVLFHGATLISGTGSPAVVDAAFLVRDGVIESVGRTADFPSPSDTARVDLSGRYVMPTIVNPHGHVGYLRGASMDAANFSRENVLDHLRRFVYYGVSVIQSLGTDRDGVEISIRDQQRLGTLVDPELALLLSAANGIAAPTPGGGNGGAFFAPEAIREADSPEQAREVVRAILTQRPDVIKFWVDDRNGTKSKFGPDIYEAIIDEAHRAGTKVIAHIYDLEDAKGVARAGVDGTAHLVRESGPDAELLALLRENDVFVFTSMSIQRAILDGREWLNDPVLAETVDQATRDTFIAMFAQTPEHVRAALTDGYRILESSLTQYVDAGVRVLLSGDTGVMAQFPGFTEHRELEAMVRAGMPTLAAIRAATLLPARMLGLHDRGSLEAGKRADFIVLDADPLLDIANTRSIADVYIAGSAIDRPALRAKLLSSEVAAAA